MSVHCIVVVRPNDDQQYLADCNRQSDARLNDSNWIGVAMTRRVDGRRANCPAMADARAGNSSRLPGHTFRHMCSIIFASCRRRSCFRFSSGAIVVVGRKISPFEPSVGGSFGPGWPGEWRPAGPEFKLSLAGGVRSRVGVSPCHQEERSRIVCVCVM